MNETKEIENNQCGAVINQQTLERCKNQGLNIEFCEGTNYLGKRFSFKVYKCDAHSVIKRGERQNE